MKPHRELKNIVAFLTPDCIKGGTDHFFGLMLIVRKSLLDKLTNSRNYMKVTFLICSLQRKVQHIFEDWL